MASLINSWFVIVTIIISVIVVVVNGSIVGRTRLYCESFNSTGTPVASSGGGNSGGGGATKLKCPLDDNPNYNVSFI